MVTPDRGDVVQLDWWDITEEPTGDPAAATPTHRTTYAVWWERRATPYGDVIITTSTIDRDDPTQQGWCAYPAAVVHTIRVIKKAKKVRHVRKSNRSVGPVDPATGDD